jgi:thioredoxin reductase
VTVSYRKEDFFRLKSRNEQRIREYMAQNRLRVLFSSQVESIAPKEVLLKVGKAGTEERLRIRNDYVFIFAGGDPPYPLLKKMGIRFGGNGNEPLTKSA